MYNDCMRRIFIAVLMLMVFASNQAAMALEPCKDPSCITISIDAEKQAEHQKKDPACATHCALSSHHAAALPTTFDLVSQREHRDAQAWPGTTMPESATLEGLIEPPSIA